MHACKHMYNHPPHTSTSIKLNRYTQKCINLWLWPKVHLWHFTWPKCPWPKCPDEMSVAETSVAEISYIRYTEVFDTFNIFQYCTLKGVRSLNFMCKLFCQLHHVAFDRLKSHTPFPSPNFLNDQYLSEVSLYPLFL